MPSDWLAYGTGCTQAESSIQLTEQMPKIEKYFFMLSTFIVNSTHFDSSAALGVGFDVEQNHLIKVCALPECAVDFTQNIA